MKKLLILILWVTTILLAPIPGRIPIDPFALSDLTRKVLFELRIPRTLMAFLAGGNLAVSGYLLQTILVNPLATPYTLGISAGASLGFLSATLLGAGFFSGNIFALLGSITGVAISYLLSLNRGSSNHNTLILSGIVVNVIFSSLILFLYYIAPRGIVIEVLHWTMGNLYPVSYSTILVISVISLLLFSILLLLKKEIELLSLGKEEAQSLGLNYDIIFIIIILSATLLTSIVVAITGPIGFIGLIVPHILTQWGFIKPEEAIIFNFMGGGILLGWSDCLSRIILPSSEIPVGVLTAFGGGIFLLIIIKKANHSGWPS